MRKIKTSPSVPTDLTIEKVGSNSSKISIYPFQTGFGVTIAHPIKRILLSSTVGFAPTSIKIEGAKHEFDNIRGVIEDVTQLILNLKSIRFKIKDDRKKIVLDYSFVGPKEIKGVDLENEDVSITTQDIHFATLNEDATLNFSIVIEQGMGYVASEDIRPFVEPDFIPVDAFFMPITKLNYTIENILVEGDTNYEKIVFDIETDGQIEPEFVFKEAIMVFYKQLAIFNKGFNLGLSASVNTDDDEAEVKKLLVVIEDLNLTARSYNCLTRSDIKFVGEIVLMQEKDMCELKNLGKKSLDELKAKIEELGYEQGGDNISESVKNQFQQKLAQLKG